LATKNTVEEGLLMSAEGKRRLEKLVIKKGNIQTMMGRGDDVSADDLKKLLLKDGEVYKFSGHKEILSDQDLEVLCDRYVFSASFCDDAGCNGSTDLVTGVTQPTRRHLLARATPPPSRLLKPLLRVSPPLLLPNPPKTVTSPEGPRWLPCVDMFHVSGSSHDHSTMYKSPFLGISRRFSRGYNYK
jgi:hypothetical protein